MNTLQKNENKKIWTLAVFAAVGSILFSFLGAPLLRAFAVSVRSQVFWVTAGSVTAALFLAGRFYYQLSETAVYVGAVWMTLGVYSELEKRGINWRPSFVASVSSGFIFALAGYFLILKNQSQDDVLLRIVEPFFQALKAARKDSADASALVLVPFIPGAIISSLFGALALGFAFEAKIARLFALRREHVASGLRWLDFYVPSIGIWTALFAVLTYAVSTPDSTYSVIAFNVIIVSLVVFFFQGMCIAEYAMRIFKMGPISRALMYLFILLQLSPFVALMGFVDYWLELRKRIRKKQKTTQN